MLAEVLVKEWYPFATKLDVNITYRVCSVYRFEGRLVGYFNIISFILFGSSLGVGYTMLVDTLELYNRFHNTIPLETIFYFIIKALHSVPFLKKCIFN